jgi:hypothetical protein
MMGVLLRFALAAILVFALNLLLDPVPGRVASVVPAGPLTSG